MNLIAQDWLYIWCLLLSVLTPFGVLLLYRRAKQSVRKRLVSRPILTFDKWYETHFDENGPDKDLTQAFMIVLSSEYSVHPTQILPSDRFDDDLRPDSWWSARGHELDLFVMWIDEATKGNYQMTDGAWTSVGELIKRVVQIRDNLPTCDDDKDETFTLPRSLSRP